MWTISRVNFVAVSLLKTPALSMEPNFKLIEDGEFFPRMFTDVASDVIGLTKRCRRHTNYVHPQKCKKGCFMERRS